MSKDEKENTKKWAKANSDKVEKSIDIGDIEVG